MNINEIRELAEIMNSAGLRRLAVTEDGCSIEMEKAVAEKTSVKTLESSELSFSLQESVEISANVVISPMVGVFYTAPSPAVEPFVSVGDSVKRGDVLCIIEAMKLMNEIVAEQEGTITEVCVQNGQTVEYGQTLFRMN